MTASGKEIQILQTPAKWLREFILSSETGSLRARFQHGITWNVTGAVLNNGANFLTNIAIANLLGREIFGQYGMIQSTLSTFVGVAYAAGGITATKYVAEFRSRDKERAGRVLGLCSATTMVTGTIATLLVLLCAPWLASTTLKAPFLARSLEIAAAVIFFTVVNAYQMGALAGLESYRQWAISNALQGPIQLGICTLAAWKWGLPGAVAGLLATSVARWIILQLALKREANRQGILLRYAGLWQERSILFRFALPAAMTGLSITPAIWLGNTFLVRQTSGYSQLALFSAAFNLKNVVMFLPLLLNNVGFSLLNNQRGGGNEASYRKVFWTTVGCVTAVVFTAAAFVGIFGTQLLRLYGKSFPEAYPTLLILLCCAVVEAIAMAVYIIIGAEEKMWLTLLAIALPRDFTLVFLAYKLTPVYGVVGLALAHAIAWLLCATVIFSTVLTMGLSPKRKNSGFGTIQLSGLLEGDLEP
jgi:O-antigen/teichoic acid export membrane protein